MIDNVKNNTIGTTPSFSSLQNQPDTISVNVPNDNKTENIIVNQKFFNVYNTDIQKCEKCNSIFKFLNAKKKYLRNSESMGVKNDYDLKKNSYIFN